MGFQSGFSVDIHFDSVDELKKGFSELKSLLPQKGPIFQMDIRLHWPKHLLDTQSLVECGHWVQFLKDRFGKVPLYMELPFCFGEKQKLATFPNCNDCAFLAANWCRWPKQMGLGPGVLQKEILPTFELDQLRATDFQGQQPMTWFYPQRHQIQLAAAQLSKSGSVFDFGAGNGFITHLLEREFTESVVITAIDPFVQPKFQPNGILRATELPNTMPDHWSLVSSLADFTVPFEICLSKNSLPRDIVFIRFPQVFGNPGQHFKIEIKGGQIDENIRRPLFTMADLQQLGYQLIYKEAVPSAHYDDTEFLVYSRVDRQLAAPAISGRVYPWQKSSDCRNATTSAFALS